MVEIYLATVSTKHCDIVWTVIVLYQKVSNLQDFVDFVLVPETAGSFNLLFWFSVFHEE